MAEVENLSNDVVNGQYNNENQVRNRLIQRRQQAINQNRNRGLYENGLHQAMDFNLPFPTEGIDEREIYSRFTSSELASYMINLFKERIHTLRLIFTLFVLTFTNLTNMVLLYPAKNAFWEGTLKFMIYLTPIWQLIWFVLLIMGRNNSKVYIFIKFSLIALISLTSILAYMGDGVSEQNMYQVCTSKLVFLVCMANISSTLLWCFFVLFSIGLIIVASIISLIFAIAFLPFLVLSIVGRLIVNTCRESVIQVYRIYSMNRMKSVYHNEEQKQNQVQNIIEDENFCAIWFLEFKQGVDYVLKFDCKHVFHQNCVEKWLKMNKNSCPLCRTKIF